MEDIFLKSLMKKILGAKIDIRLLSIGTFLLLIVLAIPIARIMMYCVPWYDDFSYGLYTKNFWEQNQSYLEALKGAIYNTRTMWHAWQGTYTSCFFMSLMPAVWGTEMYKIGLWLILFTLIIGIFVLVSVLFKDVLKIKDRWSCLFVQSMVSITVMLFMRSAIEGFFWYNSAVHYTAMHSLGILYVAMLIKLVCTKGKIKTCILLILSMLFGFVIGGVNNVTVLQVGLTILSIIFFGIIFKKKRVVLLIPVVLCYGIAMFLNLSAPGNAKRAALYVGMKLTPIEAVLRSFESAFTYLDDFTGWMTLAIVVFMIPVAVETVKKTSFQFKYPLLVLLWSFCLYATGFTPTLYMMGHTLLGRATNMAKVTFQLLLFVNLFYLIGWLCRLVKQKKEKGLSFKPTWSYCVVLAMIMALIFIAEPNKGGIYSTYCAYYFVHTGEANNYYKEYKYRVHMCESSEEADIVVHPYGYKPWVLCLGDLSEDPNYEPNKFMAQFFRKNSIRCITPSDE